MTINPNDGYYKAEQTSPTILAMRAQLCAAYGVGVDHFGAKGNLAHSSGYHRSRNWILNSPDSPYRSRDYSVLLAADKGNDDDVAAVDFTPAEWGTPDNTAKMIAITRRVITAMQDDDPRVAALREFAGTLDGEHVVTYDHSRHAFKTPFDSSHLHHGHGSIYRTMTRVDHSGIVSVMIGAPEGEDMFLRNAANGGIYLAAGGRIVGVEASEWAAVSPQTFVNCPGSLIAKLLAAPTATVELTDEQTTTVSDAARDGAAEGVSRLRLSVDPA